MERFGGGDSWRLLTAIGLLISAPILVFADLPTGARALLAWPAAGACLLFGVVFLFSYLFPPTGHDTGGRGDGLMGPPTEHDKEVRYRNEVIDQWTEIGHNGVAGVRFDNYFGRYKGPKD